LDYTICTGRYGNGVPILGIKTTMAHPQTEQFGNSAETYIVEYFAEARGVSAQKVVVALAAVGMNLKVG
jgi:hypothetical protein